MFSGIPVDEEAVRDFSNIFLSYPKSCIEIAYYGAYINGRTNFIDKSTKSAAVVAGWYTDPGKMYLACCRANHISVYSTFNPSSLSRRPQRLSNKLGYIRRGEGVNESDIIHINWILIDIDPSKDKNSSSKHINSTDEQNAKCIAKAKEIMSSTSHFHESSVIINSGNGASLLLRLDLPNNEESRSAIKKLSRILSEKFTDSDSIIDTSATSSICRHVGVPGTVKFKASDSTIDRPWRKVCIVGDHSFRFVSPANLTDYVKQNEKKIEYHFMNESSPNRESGEVKHSPSKRKINQARHWLARRPGAVEGQFGNRYTYGVATALIKGFDLSAEEAYSLMVEWNASCQPPWSEVDIRHKVDGAFSSADSRPRGYFLSSSEHRHKREFETSDLEKLAISFEEEFGIRPVKSELKIKDASDVIELNSDDITDEVYLARLFLIEHTKENNTCEYIYWNQTFYRWNGSFYKSVADKVFTSTVKLFVDSCFRQHYEQKPEEYIDSKGRSIPKRKATDSQANGVITVLYTLLAPKEEHHADPFWIKRYDKWDTKDMMFFKNIVVHIPSYMSGDDMCIIKKTNEIFTTHNLNYDFPLDFYFDQIKTPRLWGDFLESIWMDDQESIDCLQEIFGYLLLPSNIYQKIFIIVGPPRCGKGTILRVLEEMVGKLCVCHPTFTSLSTNFGLFPLLGKLVAIMDDVRISPRMDIIPVVERILSISGGDPQTIDRKHMAQMPNVSLNTRFIMSSNETPKLLDNSAAVASRVIALRLTESFLGREDSALFSSLLPEIPGILLWSIAGLKRLYARKRFEQPESGLEIINEMYSLSSPIHQFVSDICDVAEDNRCPAMELYREWQDWCNANGKGYHGDLQTFVRNLRAIIPSMRIEDKILYGVKQSDMISRSREHGPFSHDWDMSGIN